MATRKYFDMGRRDPSSNHDAILKLSKEITLPVRDPNWLNEAALAVIAKATKDLMGIDYNLFDMENELQFELGSYRNSFSNLFRQDRIEITKKMNTSDFISHMMLEFQDNAYFEDKMDEFRDWIADASQRIHKFCVNANWNIELHSDTGDIYFARKHWQLIDTVYENSQIAYSKKSGWYSYNTEHWSPKLEEEDSE